MSALRRIKILFCVALASMPFFARAQKAQISTANADATKPYVLTDTLFGPTNAPDGPGADLEISGNSITDSLYIEDEHNTVWYKYTTPCPCELTFDIIPQSLSNDYDFMLYRYNGKASDFVSKMKTKAVKPIRSCISRNDKKLKSKTGLAKNLDINYIHQGIGPSYVSSVPANKGDVFYLLVDNVYKNGRGHTIHIHCKPPKPGEIFVGYRLQIGDIFFVPEADTVLKKSYPALDSLVAILKRHPTMRVEIQGHVNAPSADFKPRRYTIQKLSELRANRVMDYCLSKGIDRKRMRPKGYGNTRMVVPDAKTLEDYKKNMRVEIVVIGM